MENIKTVDIELLAKQKKEAKKRFKDMEKYMKEELKETRKRIYELEEIIEEYYQLENKIESILEETALIETGIKEIKEKYEFKTTEGKDVFQDMYLVRGDYLLMFEGEEGARNLSIGLKKKDGKRWKEEHPRLGEKGKVLIEIEYTGVYYLSVSSRGAGYKIEIISQRGEE